MHLLRTSGCSDSPPQGRSRPLAFGLHVNFPIQDRSMDLVLPIPVRISELVDAGERLRANGISTQGRIQNNYFA